jgi:excinuclease UvrABC helicase subunit UvrB
MAAKKKTRYNKITFKLTTRQRQSLEAYCRNNNTTPVKLIKDSINHALKDGHQKPGNKSNSVKGQLDLEDLIDEITRENGNKDKDSLPFPDKLF